MTRYINKDLKLIINTSSEKLVDVEKELEKIYSNIPNTKCLFCPNKCEVTADCCKTFHPPMYLSEFLIILKQLDDWEEQDRKNLLFSCYKSFLDPEIVKPCVLLGDDNRCMVYKNRPTCCRFFGLYSNQEWTKRLRSVSESLGISKEKVPFNKQCKNIEVDAKINFLTTKQTNSIMSDVAKLDVSLFPDKFTGSNFTRSGATYLPFDAHYLLMNIGPDSLEELTKLRMGLSDFRKLYKNGKILEDQLKRQEDNVELVIESVRNIIFNQKENE